MREDRADRAPKRQDLVSDGPLSSGFEFPVHHPEQVEKLATDRGVRLDRDRPERLTDAGRTTVRRHIEKPGPDLQVLPPFDADVRVAVPVAHRVPRVLHRDPPHITDDVTLVFEESMTAVRGQQHKEPPMADVLHVRDPQLLPSGPGPLGDIDPIPLHKLGVHAKWILAVRNAA